MSGGRVSRRRHSRERSLPGYGIYAIMGCKDRRPCKKPSTKSEQVMPYFEKKIPPGRLRKKTDVADMAAFIASDRASYITGQAINISGSAIMH